MLSMMKFQLILALFKISGSVNYGFEWKFNQISQLAQNMFCFHRIILGAKLIVCCKYHCNCTDLCAYMSFLICVCMCVCNYVHASIMLLHVSKRRNVALHFSSILILCGQSFVHTGLRSLCFM